VDAAWEEPMTHAQINKTFEKKIRKGIFKPVARLLSNQATAEDRLQDAICQTWAMFMRYAERGKILDDALWVKKCKWSACDLGRSFVPADGCWRNQDIYDPRAYHSGKVELLHIDGICNDQDTEGDKPLQVGLAEEMAASPERMMISAHDLQQWVGGLRFQNQAIMERKMASKSSRWRGTIP
jgi:hypothetical protein